jgi:hypothetical protein
MPLSPSDLTAIRSAITRLIGALEALQPSLGAGDPIEQMRTELLGALHPSGITRWRGGDTDIRESALDRRVKVQLTGLRRFLLSGAFHDRAVCERDETIVYLEGLLPEVEDGGVRPGKLPAVDNEDREILRILNKLPELLQTRDQIANKSFVSHKTVCARLPRLEKWGYVSRFWGPKRGWRITQTGSELIERLDKADPPKLAR